MYPSLVLSAALITPAAPVPRDTVPSTPGPAPQVLALKADASGTVRIVGTIPTKVTVTNAYFTVEQVMENGKPVQRQVQKQIEQDVVTSQYVNKTLADCNGKFMTADGKPLTVDEANNRVKNGATVLVSSDGKPISKAWLRAVSADTVVMVAEGFSHVQVQWGGAPMPTTPAPRLTMLGTDDSGKLVAPCTSSPITPNGGVYYDDMIFEGRAMGKRAIRSDIYYGGYPQQYDAKVVLKPLADVKFDAYDINGKLVSRTETLKRLSAGGMVIMAGDSRMPDENYLKGFREDVLILVSPELVLPVTPVDQTKKKDQTKEEPGKDPKALPADKVAPPVLQPAPAIKLAPAVIKGGRAAGGVQVLPAPAVEEKPVKEEKPAEKPVEKK